MSMKRKIEKRIALKLIRNQQKITKIKRRGENLINYDNQGVISFDKGN